MAKSRTIKTKTIVYLHDFDLVACLRTGVEDFDQVPTTLLLAAMQARLDSLKNNTDEAADAFGHVQTNTEIEIDETRTPTAKPLCPHCNKPFPIPDVVQENHRHYQNSSFTLKHTCGKMVRMHLMRTVTAECMAAPDSAQDDFGAGRAG